MRKSFLRAQRTWFSLHEKSQAANLCLSPQTLGHLEKAVVLELTLKHLNALTAVTEQQHQKIVALQNGEINKLDHFLVRLGCII